MKNMLWCVQYLRASLRWDKQIKTRFTKTYINIEGQILILFFYVSSMIKFASANYFLNNINLKNYKIK